jgi:hypothetical protein
MTLAVILLNVSFALSPLQSTTAPAQTASPATPTNAAATQDQSNTQPHNSATQSQPAQSNSAEKKPSAATSHATHRPHKRKVPPADCNPTPANGSSTSGAAATSTDPTQSAKTPTNPGTTVANPAADAPSVPTNCPPPKIVVDQGGTSEPSIQLAGDAKSSPLRDTNQCPNASQCLQSAEQNLKKIAGRRLNASQRDMVTQVNQFMDQSKHATSTGDVESARTLAWKAQQISQELVDPEK